MSFHDHDIVEKLILIIVKGRDMLQFGVSVVNLWPPFTYVLISVVLSEKSW